MVPTVPNECNDLVRNMAYHLKDEALAALRLLPKWRHQLGIAVELPESATPSEQQWLSQSIPSDTPDNTTLSAIVC